VRKSLLEAGEPDPLDPARRLAPPLGRADAGEPSASATLSIRVRQSRLSCW
jgi:hypothetical protein